MIGCSATQRGPARASRLNQMFGQAVNRCQATPIVVFRAITINQVIEMTILIMATRIDQVLQAGGAQTRTGIAEEPGQREVATVVPVAVSAYSSAAQGQDADARSEDDGLDEVGLPDPSSRRTRRDDPRCAGGSAAGSRSAPTMPIRVSQAIRSRPPTRRRSSARSAAARSVGIEQLPVRGDQGEEQGDRTRRTRTSAATPTSGHCSIRVCPRVSVTSSFQRSPRRSLRPTAGRPSRTTATIERMARTNSTTATAVIASETTIATTCTVLCSSVRGLHALYGACTYWGLAPGGVLVVNLNPTRQ